jgi:Protein of unknown function (DUF1573)
MKKLLILPFLFIAAVTVKAQVPVTSAPIDNPTAPNMSFDQKEYKFGTIKQGESATYEFKFTNTGKEPLIITNAQGSCGCTVPEYPKEPIKPNGSGTVKVTFNSTGKMGPQDKTVTLTYDNGRTETLHMIGTVEAANTQAPAAAQPAPAPANGTKPAPAGKTTAPAVTPATPAAKPAPASKPKN